MMTSLEGDEEFSDLDTYLQRTQDQISCVLSSLSAANLTESLPECNNIGTDYKHQCHNAFTKGQIQGHEGLLSSRGGSYCDLQKRPSPLRGHLRGHGQYRNQGQLISSQSMPAVDFLAIFGEHGLLSDNITPYYASGRSSAYSPIRSDRPISTGGLLGPRLYRDLGTRIDNNNRGCNFDVNKNKYNSCIQLNNQKAERPTTLKIATKGEARRSRSKLWRSYTKNGSLFSPIQSENEADHVTSATREQHCVDTDEGVVRSTPRSSTSTMATLATSATTTSSDSGISARCGDSSGHSAEGTLDTLEQYEHCINNVFASREVTENMQSNSTDIHSNHVPQCTGNTAGHGSITMQPCSDVTNLCDMDKPVMSSKDHIGVGGDSIRKADISELELIINSLEDQNTAGTSVNCEDNNNVVVHPRTDAPVKPSVTKGGKFTSKLDSKLLTNVGKRLVNQMYRLSRSRSSSVERGDGKQSADTSPARAKHKSNGRLGEHDQAQHKQNHRSRKPTDHPLARLSRSRSSSTEKEPLQRKSMLDKGSPRRQMSRDSNSTGQRQSARSVNMAADAVQDSTIESTTSTKQCQPLRPAAFSIPPPPPINTADSEPSILDGLRSRQMQRQKINCSDSYRHSNPEGISNTSSHLNGYSQSVNGVNNEMKITRVMRNTLSWNGVLGQQNKYHVLNDNSRNTINSEQKNISHGNVMDLKNTNNAHNQCGKENRNSLITTSLPAISRGVDVSPKRNSTTHGSSPERVHRKRKPRSRSVEIINKMKQDSSSSDSDDDNPHRSSRRKPQCRAVSRIASEERFHSRRRRARSLEKMNPRTSDVKPTETQSHEQPQKDQKPQEQPISPERRQNTTGRRSKKNRSRSKSLDECQTDRYPAFLSRHYQLVQQREGRHGSVVCDSTPRQALSVSRDKKTVKLTSSTGTQTAQPDGRIISATLTYKYYQTRYAAHNSAKNNVNRTTNVKGNESNKILTNSDNVKCAENDASPNHEIYTQTQCHTLLAHEPIVLPHAVQNSAVGSRLAEHTPVVAPLLVQRNSYHMPRYSVRLPLPAIEEDPAVKSPCNSDIEVRSETLNSTKSEVGTDCSSGSLLDTMHRKFCARQYQEQQETSCLNSTSIKLQEQETLESNVAVSYDNDYCCNSDVKSKSIITQDAQETPCVVESSAVVSADPPHSAQDVWIGKQQSSSSPTHIVQSVTRSSHTNVSTCHGDVRHLVIKEPSSSQEKKTHHSPRVGRKLSREVESNLFPIGQLSRSPSPHQIRLNTPLQVSPKLQPTHPGKLTDFPHRRQSSQPSQPSQLRNSPQRSPKIQTHRCSSAESVLKSEQNESMDITSVYMDTLTRTQHQLKSFQTQLWTMLTNTSTDQMAPPGVKHVNTSETVKTISCMTGEDCIDAQDSKVKEAEIEAAEACRWLRAAGFPQYAQMYTDHLYPLDVTTVQRDHDFLDSDSLQSLYRRISTLNKCATMKIEAPTHKHQEDSDDDDECALSDKWRYQRASDRWLRYDNQEADDGRTTLQSCSSHDSVITDNEESHQDGRDSPLLSSSHARASRTHSSTSKDSGGADGHSLLLSPALRRAASERIKSAKNLLKKMESLRRPRKSSSSLRSVSRDDSRQFLEISNPTAVTSDSLEERMQVLGCVDISPASTPSNTDVISPLVKRTMSSPADTAGQPTTTTKTKTENLITVNSSPTPHRRNHSSTALDEAVLLLDPDYKPGSFPKVITNGYIDMGNGSQVNYRTGSFNMGADSYNFKDNLKKRIHANTKRTLGKELSPSPPVIRTKRMDAVTRNENRLSIYDNIPSPLDVLDQEPTASPAAPNIVTTSATSSEATNSNAQVELDLILHNLYQNINDLNQSLTDDITLNATTTTTTASTTTATTTKSENLVDVRHGTSTVTDECVASSAPPPTSTAPTSSAPPPSSRITSTSGTSQPARTAPVTTVQSPSLPTTTASSVLIEGAPTTSRPTSIPGSIQGSIQGSVPGSVTVTPTSSHSCGSHSSCLDCDAERIHSSMAVDDSLLLMDRSSVSTNSSSHELSDDDYDGVAGAGSRDGSQGSLGSRGSQDDDDCVEGAAEGSRERRDSGVGSSLTRAPSDRRRHRIRWHSFVKSHRPSLNSRNLQISNMSAGQLLVMHKLSLLKVTAIMEKYSPTIRSGWNWIMPKFIKRFKSPDYKDKRVFGVPLHVILQRTGQPLPQCIMYAMRCLRRNALDAVGIFRKSGVRSRIQKLRNQIEADPEATDFENLQSYDVADLLKQYFRELPESLLTSKLSETFISIFTNVPSDMRLESLQAAVLLLPDENREVLQSLLLFLSDMAEHSAENQMNASNLAVCFAPSLFHMCGVRPNAANPASVASPKRSRKQMNAAVPDQRELMEQKSAHQCLTAMIGHCKQLFTVPEDMLSKCRLSYIAQGDPVPISELGHKCSSEDESSSDHVSYMESCVQGLLKESMEKFKGWVHVGSEQGIDVAYKKVGDGHPLRLWKCCVDVEAPPAEVLHRIMSERHLWDDDLLKWRVVESLDNGIDVFQFVLNSMAPHPTRDFVEIRSWRTDLTKGACVLVSTSVEHPDAPLIGGVQGVILASRYLIEPCGSGKSRLTHICRVDLRGHTPDWYNKSYSHLCVNMLARMRNSFKQPLEISEGPETKV